MTAFLLVAAGGALGAAARYALVTLLPARFPWAVLLANVAGSLVLGILLVSAQGDLMLLAGVGFCGALTTFSTFALDTLVLAREGRPRASAANVGLSVAACIAAVVAGMALARAMGLG
jgi:CrcB protein